MLCECRCDTCFLGHFGRRIRWKHSFLRPTHSEVKVRSKSGQLWLNRQTQNFILKHAYIVQFCLRIQKMTFILMYGYQKCAKIVFQQHKKKIGTALLRNPCAQVNFFSLRDVLLIRY